MKVAICDDDVSVCDIIEDILCAYSKKNNIFIDVYQFYKVESLIQSIEDGNSFNLIYQDIEFPNMTGIDFGEFLRVRTEDFFTDVVFISGANSYDRQLFSFQPLYFISKPFNNDEIIKSLELSLKKLDNNNSIFTYKKSGKTIFVPLNEIMFFESISREILIQTISTKDLFYESLNNLEQSLNNSSFLRVHNSYLVNTRFIKSINKSVIILKNDFQISISRKYKDNILEFVEGII